MSQDNTYKQYKEQEWQEKRQPPQNVQQASKIHQLHGKELKQQIKSIKDQLKKELQEEGLKVDADSLVKSYQEQNQQLMSAIKSLEENLGKGVTSGELGIPYRQKQMDDRELYKLENEIIKEKVGFVPSGVNLDEWMDRLHIQRGSISHKKLRELLLLDDWGAIATIAAPYLIKYGKQAIDWLWQKYVVEKFGQNDWGAAVTDQGRNPTREMWKIAPLEGVNVQFPNTKLNPTVSSEHFIDINFVRALLSPEYYTSRLPAQGLYPATTIRAVNQYAISSTDTGSTAIIVVTSNGYNGISTGTGINQNFISYNPLTCNLETGEYTSFSSSTGPLSGIQNLESYRLVSMSIQFVPTLSITSATGSVSQVTYAMVTENNLTKPKANGQLDILQNATMAQQEMFQAGNMLTTYRQSLPLNRLQSIGVATQVFPGTTVSSTQDGGFYPNVNVITIQGAPTQTVIGKLFVYYNYEIRYTPGTTRFIQHVTYPQSSATLEFCQRLSMNPSYFMQSSNDMKELLTPSEQPSFVPSVGNVLSLLTNSKSVNTQDAGYSNVVGNQSVNASMIFE